jgi:hypothetical protein
MARRIIEAWWLDYNACPPHASLGGLASTEFATRSQHRLASVPSVGKTIARTLIAELPELASLDRRRIAAFVGLPPWTRQFGQWCGKSFIGGGRKSVRNSLFIGTIVAARYNTRSSNNSATNDKLVAAGNRQPELFRLRGFGLSHAEGARLDRQPGLHRDKAADAFKGKTTAPLVGIRRAPRDRPRRAICRITS